MLQDDEGQIETASGQEGRSEMCQLILQLGIWSTLLQEEEGQVEAAGGQEGRSEVCQLILQLGHFVYLAAGG